MTQFLQNLKLISKNNYKVILLLFISFLFSACNGSYPPIEADDFGFPKYAIYAKGQNVTGEEGNQLADWELTGYKYNGDTITIMVYNPMGTSYIWGPWLCDGDDDICENMTSAQYCILASDCTDPTDCTSSTSTCLYGASYCPMTSTAGFCCDSNASDCAGVMYETFPNAPCLLQQGQGLYLLITNPATIDTYGNNPNTYPNINKQPYQADFYTKGLWYPSGAYQNDEPAMGYYGSLTVPDNVQSSTSATDYIGGYAYMKIVDRYYDDNSGYLYASLKTGFDQIIPPPIDTIISFVTTALDSTAQAMYTRLVNESDFRTSIKILLVMYIVIHGIMYMGGLTEMSGRDLVSMSIKLIIVIQLTTATASWNLFNTYFFNFFTSGMNEMINIVTSNLPGSGEFSFFDSLLGLLFSYETNVKIYALIASFPCGILVTIMIYIAFAIFTIGIAQAVMIYLLSYMAIDLLIVVAPIFLSFMLFESTKSFFESWLNMFCVYFLQAVVVMAALSLLAQIIVDQIYLILGFEACYNNWIVVNYSGTSFVIAKTWQICPFFDTMDYIAVPGYWYDTDYVNSTDGSVTTKYCDPYECWATRYVNLPFLDTNSEASLIDDFRSAPGGNALNTPMLYNSSILIITCYLMMRFNEITPSLAKGISGGNFESAIGNAGRAITKDIGATASGFKNAAFKAATGNSQAEREKWMRMKSQMIKRTAITAVSENVVDPLKRNVVDPAKQAAISVATGAKNLAGKAASGATNIATGTAKYLGGQTAKGATFVASKADALKDSALGLTGTTKAERQKYRQKAVKRIVQNTSKLLDKCISKERRQEWIDSVKISQANQKILKETAQSAASFSKRAITSTASGSMKAAGALYNSAKATAPKSVYSLGGFVKDMLIPPGSLMGFTYTPEGPQEYKSQLLRARNQIKARNAQEEKDTYDKFHRDRQAALYKKEKSALDKWHKEEQEKAINAQTRSLSKNAISDSYQGFFEKGRQEIDRIRLQEKEKDATDFQKAYERAYNTAVTKSKYLPSSYKYMLKPEEAQQVYEKFYQDRQALLDRRMNSFIEASMTQYEKARLDPNFSQEKAQQLQNKYRAEMNDLSYGHYLGGKKDLKKVFESEILKRYEEDFMKAGSRKDMTVLNKRWNDTYISTISAIDRVYSKSLGNTEFERLTKEGQITMRSVNEVHKAHSTIAPSIKQKIDQEYQERLSKLKYQDNEKGRAEYEAKSQAARVTRLEYNPKELGYKYDKSHRETLVDMFKKNTGIADIEKRAAEFDRKRRDEYGDTLGMALFKAGLGNIDKIAYYAALGPLGWAASKTKSGKAAADQYSKLKQNTLDKVNKMKKSMVEAIRESLQDPKIKKQKEKEALAQSQAKIKQLAARKQAKKERRRLARAAKLKKQLEERNLKKQREKEQRDKDREARRAARFAARLAARQKTERTKKNVLEELKNKAIEKEMKQKGIGRELAIKFLDIKGRGAELSYKGDQARAASQIRAANNKKILTDELAYKFEKMSKIGGAKLAKLGDAGRTASQTRVAKPQGASSGEFTKDSKFIAKMTARREHTDKHTTEAMGTVSPPKNTKKHTYIPTVGAQLKVTESELNTALQGLKKNNKARVDKTPPKRDTENELITKFKKMAETSGDMRAKLGDDARTLTQNQSPKGNTSSKLALELKEKQAKKFGAQSETKGAELTQKGNDARAASKISAARREEAHRTKTEYEDFMSKHQNGIPFDQTDKHAELEHKKDLAIVELHEHEKTRGHKEQNEVEVQKAKARIRLKKLFDEVPTPSQDLTKKSDGVAKQTQSPVTKLKRESVSEQSSNPLSPIDDK